MLLQREVGAKGPRTPHGTAVEIQAEPEDPTVTHPIRVYGLYDIGENQ